MTGRPLERLRSLALHVHDETCPVRGEHDATSCRSTLSRAAAEALLDSLDREPRSAYAARLALHDVYCASGCRGAGRDEHARRHARVVASARRWVGVAGR